MSLMKNVSCSVSEREYPQQEQTVISGIGQNRKEDPGGALIPFCTKTAGCIVNLPYFSYHVKA